MAGEGATDPVLSGSCFDLPYLLISSDDMLKASHNRCLLRTPPQPTQLLVTDHPSISGYCRWTPTACSDRCVVRNYVWWWCNLPRGKRFQNVSSPFERGCWTIGWTSCLASSYKTLQVPASQRRERTCFMTLPWGAHAFHSCRAVLQRCALSHAPSTALTPR